MNENEEKFLRFFSKMGKWEKKLHYSRYINIQHKVGSYLIEEKERLMNILNQEKWFGWDLELF